MESWIWRFRIKIKINQIKRQLVPWNRGEGIAHNARERKREKTITMSDKDKNSAVQYLIVGAIKVINATELIDREEWSYPREWNRNFARTRQRENTAPWDEDHAAKEIILFCWGAKGYLRTDRDVQTVQCHSTVLIVRRSSRCLLTKVEKWAMLRGWKRQPLVWHTGEGRWHWIALR